MKKDNVVKTLHRKCPNCLNVMIFTVHNNKCLSGRCPVCKSKIFSREHSSKERLIRIVKAN